MVVVTVEVTVLPLKVRVLSHEKPSSPGRDTCLGEGGLFRKDHWVVRLGRGIEAIVLRFSDTVRRCSDDIRGGIMGMLADERESVENENSLKVFWCFKRRGV